MTLRLTVKPGEALHIGTTRVTIVAEATSTVIIEGNAPVLRAHEMVDDADQDAGAGFRRVLQRMYLEQRSQVTLDYVESFARVLDAAPALHGTMLSAHERVCRGRLYEALKLCRRLRVAEIEPVAANG